jgi:hypothetical protein
VALLVERRPAGVARVRRRVRLDRAGRHPAHDPGRDAAVEAVRAADQQQLVAGARQLPCGTLPERLRAGRPALDADHRQVVPRVARVDLPAPGTALARDGDAGPDLAVDDVIGRDQVAGVAVAPGDEAAAEPVLGLDGEDALEHSRREWGDTRLAPLQRLLGRPEASGERRIALLERVDALLEAADLRPARRALGVDGAALADEHEAGERQRGAGRDHGDGRDREAAGRLDVPGLVVRHRPTPYRQGGVGD